MSELFTAEFFAGNRVRLRDVCGHAAPIVITANGQLQRSADTMYPFKQDANFWYLTGIKDPDIILVIDKNSEYLILPKRSEYQNIFDGHVDRAALSQDSGIADIVEYEAGWERLGDRLRNTNQVATIVPPPQYIEVYGMYTNPARQVLHASLLRQNEKLELTDIREHLTKLRMVKQIPEIAAITQAIAITTKGLQEVVQSARLQKYTYEYEVEADLTRAFKYQDSNHAFEPIIAGGERACTLHNVGSTGKLSTKELLLFDIGAEHKGYAADISRTVAIGKPSKRQQQIHSAVQEVQAYAVSQLKPGIILLDYEKQIERFMGKKLQELGLITTVKAKAVRKFYPHATSHHLGLDVHDADDRTRPLEQNMVITVEPGIYVPEEKIGIRIEDDVRITDTGVEILSHVLSTELQ